MQFQICLKIVPQAATKSTDADQQRAKVELGHEIHQVTPDKYEILKQLIQYHGPPQWQNLQTKSTCPRSTFANMLTTMKTSAEEDVCSVANMTPNKHVEFQVCLSGVDTATTTWSIANRDWDVNQLKTEIYSITSNEQMGFKMEFYICLIPFNAWQQAISFLELRKTITQCVIPCGDPLRQIVCPIS